ncbi:synapsin-1-like isoform X2 [Vidua macroura]|uniref:synapsin-1-like isoform X2 n=1 Tax=Vidua macroura TaxID=187451 RepID=UPI0023A8B99F|nr:synapsin-1-like isoform X2 [Vidua macroura]
MATGGAGPPPPAARRERPRGGETEPGQRTRTTSGTLHHPMKPLCFPTRPYRHLTGLSYTPQGLSIALQSPRAVPQGLFSTPRGPTINPQGHSTTPSAQAPPGTPAVLYPTAPAPAPHGHHGSHRRTWGVTPRTKASAQAEEAMPTPLVCQGLWVWGPPEVTTSQLWEFGITNFTFHFREFRHGQRAWELHGGGGTRRTLLITHSSCSSYNMRAGSKVQKVKADSAWL